MNCLGPDPGCDIDCAPNEARDLRFNVAVSQSFAFGGLNAAVAIRAI
jgi:nodulation protein E